MPSHYQNGSLYDSRGALVVSHTAGAYGYISGTAAGNVDIPLGAQVTRVTLVPGAGTATVTILGGSTITVPQNTSFDEEIMGEALGTAAANEVVIGGTVASFYVAWVV